MTTLQNRPDHTTGYLAEAQTASSVTTPKTAVIAQPQKANQLDADGVVGTDTSARLYASNVVSNTVSTTETLRAWARSATRCAICKTA